MDNFHSSYLLLEQKNKLFIAYLIFVLMVDNKSKKHGEPKTNKISKNKNKSNHIELTSCGFDI